jgi:hypothetical protein
VLDGENVTVTSQVSLEVSTVHVETVPLIPDEAVESVEEGGA